MPTHCQLFLDGKPFVVAQNALIVNSGLRVGLEIEAEIVDRLIAADEVIRAKNHALSLLREEIQSKGQMETRLEQEGFTEPAIHTVITELIQAGNIRDRKYAENWVRRRQKSNPRGKTVLKQELVERGIDLKTAEKVVAEVEIEDEERLALELAQKRARQYKRLPLHVAKRRLHGVLARRGFDAETIQQVLNQVF